MSPRLQRLGDRLNPVLVKEVRQAIRGRFFRISFGFMLMLAGLAGSLVLANIGDSPRSVGSSGIVFFGTLHTIFIVVAFLIVPQIAARSMAAEREERTYDALVISGLRPAQIILGKWLSASVIFGLFLCAFAPFLVLGFSLQGLDPLVGVSLLMMTLAFGFFMIIVALWSAAVARNRAAATMLSVLYALAAVFCGFMWISLNWAIIWDSSGIPAGEFFTILVLSLIATPLVAGWVYSCTVSSVTHPEENASARVRLANSLIAVGCAIAITMVYLEYVQEEILTLGIMMAYFVITLVNVPTMTESNLLGRRCLHHLEDKRWNLPFSWLLLPGGARGYLLYLMQLVVVTLPLLTWSSAGSSRTSVFDADGLGMTIATLFVCLGCTGVLASIAANPRRSPTKRHLLRMTIVAMPLLILIVVALLDLLISPGRGALLGSGMNPFWLIGRDDAAFSSKTAPGLVAWALFGAFGFFLHLFAFIGSRAQITQARRAIRKRRKQVALEQE